MGFRREALGYSDARGWHYNRNILVPLGDLYDLSSPFLPSPPAHSSSSFPSQCKDEATSEPASCACDTLRLSLVRAAYHIRTCAKHTFRKRYPVGQLISVGHDEQLHDNYNDGRRSEHSYLDVGAANDRYAHTDNDR